MIPAFQLGLILISNINWHYYYLLILLYVLAKSIPWKVNQTAKSKSREYQSLNKVFRAGPSSIIIIIIFRIQLTINYSIWRIVLHHVRLAINRDNFVIKLLITKLTFIKNSIIFSLLPHTNVFFALLLRNYLHTVIVFWLISYHLFWYYLHYYTTFLQ